MTSFIVLVDDRCQISSADVERLFSLQFGPEDFEAIDMEAGVLPSHCQNNLGAFLDSRRHYATKILQDYPSAHFCLFVATTYLYPTRREFSHPVATDFIVAANLKKTHLPYSAANPMHANIFQAASCHASGIETLDSLWEKVEEEMDKAYS